MTRQHGVFDPHLLVDLVLLIYNYFVAQHLVGGGGGGSGIMV